MRTIGRGKPRATGLPGSPPVTLVGTKVLLRGLLVTSGGMRTAVENLWMDTTDQKVGGSNSSERAGKVAGQGYVPASDARIAAERVHEKSTPRRKMVSRAS